MLDREEGLASGQVRVAGGEFLDAGEDARGQRPAVVIGCPLERCGEVFEELLVVIEEAEGGERVGGVGAEGVREGEPFVSASQL